MDLAEEDREGKEGATEISQGGTLSGTVSCGRPTGSTAISASGPRGSMP